MNVGDSTWQIYAHGDYAATAQEPLPDMKTLTQASVGKNIRRIGRFIQLALIGAARCANGRALPLDTAVYLASGRGDLELTVDIVTALFRDGQTPKPLNFVNTVSNAACFYVAQALGLQSRSNFVCNQSFALENALQLALLDLQSGRVHSALIGAVDIAVAPLAEHRRRLRLPIDTMIGEGSHWLWLGKPTTELPNLGSVIDAVHCEDLVALQAWVARREIAADACALAAGPTMSEPEIAAVRSATGLRQYFDYRQEHEHGYYDCRAAAALSLFLRSAHPFQHLLHVSSDREGRFAATLIQRA